MPSIEFHVLSEAGELVRYRYACQLAEQAYEQEQRVFIRTANAAESQRIDELLWTFSDRVFIPHEISSADSPSHPRIAVLIGNGEAPEAYPQLVINLSPDVPPQLENHTRVAEIVDADNERKKQARERYKQYRDRGCTLETKNIGA